jgi:hypothetical protein
MINGLILLFFRQEMNGGTIQTIIMPKTIPAAKQKAFLKKHGFATGKDIKTNTVRYRQEQPTHFIKSTFRTYEIGNDGIKIVSGKLKRQFRAD